MDLIVKAGLFMFLTTAFLNPIHVFPAGDGGQHQLRTVVIDPGHGGSDPGAVVAGVQEKDIVLAVGLRLGEKIKNQYPDLKIIYTRSRDVFIPLYARADIAIRNKADLFISLHANFVRESSVRGTETYTLGLHRSQENLEVAKKENAVILLEDNYTTNYEGFNPNETESYIMFENLQAEYQTQSIDLAAKIQDEFTSNIKLNNRGVRQAGFLVLRETAMPSVLVEMGFISNPLERKFLVSDAGKEKVAESIFRAFIDYKKNIDVKSMFNVGISERSDEGSVNELKSEPPKSDQANIIKEGNAMGDSARDVSVKQPVLTTQPDEPIDPDRVKKVKPAKTTSQIIPDSMGQEKQTNINRTSGQTLPVPLAQENTFSRAPNPDQPFYSVQVGATGNAVETVPANFKGEKQIFRVRVSPYYKYYTGKFTSIREALKERSRLQAKFPGAFPVVFENNIPRPLKNDELP